MKHLLKNQYMGGIPGFLMALFCALMISACGGGGGSAGKTNENPDGGSSAAKPDARVAKVTIEVSSDTMPAAAGSVAVTVRATDASNNVVQGATVVLQADSGVLSRTSTDRLTDKDGLLKETLTSPGDATERTITLTAKIGTAATATKTVKVVAARPTLQLTSSSGTLDSAGVAGNEVTVTAVVRDAGNSVMANVPVKLSTNSGSLSFTKRETDANGSVSEKLSTGSDPTARTITVTAEVAGAQTQTIDIRVEGHKILISANETANLGKASKISATLQDASGKPLADKVISFSAKNSPEGLTIAGTKTKSPARTNSQGQIQLDFVPATGPDDVITISSLGVSTTKTIIVNTLNFTVSGVDANNAPITTAFVESGVCTKLLTQIDDRGQAVSGKVTISSSRGTVFSDASCRTPLSSAQDLVSGKAAAYVSANSPGVASIVVNLLDSSGKIIASSLGELEFVAKLVSTANINIQADPAVVGPGKSSTLKAIVRDGTALNNLVKDATVVFSIDSDPSGGVLTQPTVVKTGADGSATVVYTGGAVATAVNGVTLRAKIQETASTASNTVALTVSGQALSITAGTGNSVTELNDTTYSKNYAVFVTDATGNPVNGATITAEVRPRWYMKGQMVFNTTLSRWVILPIPGNTPDTTIPHPECPNEDLNSDGILNVGEDLNGNNALDPRIPITVTGEQKTGPNGIANLTIAYPQDRAYWTAVDITIRARVTGSEATYKAFTVLWGFADDYSDATISPPGVQSPYGIDAINCNNTR